MAERSTGASRRPSRQPRSFSIAIERLSPRVPANAKVDQSTPAVTDWRVLRSNSRAKLKMRMINREKTSIAEKSSRERNSARTSFQTTAATALRKLPLDVVRSATDRISVALSTRLTRQCLLIERQQIGSPEFPAGRRSRNDAA